MILQRGRFWAVALASRRSMSNSFRSSATLRSQVERGRPGGLLQSSVGCSNRRRHMSAESSIRATCPKSERRRDRLEVSPLIQLGSGGALEAPRAASGAKLRPKTLFVHFMLKTASSHNSFALLLCSSSSTNNNRLNKTLTRLG